MTAKTAKIQNQEEQSTPTLVKKDALDKINEAVTDIIFKKHNKRARKNNKLIDDLTNSFFTELARLVFLIPIAIVIGVMKMVNDGFTSALKNMLLFVERLEVKTDKKGRTYEKNG